MRLSWDQLLVAFLAGYGLMSLILWLFAAVGRVRGRPPTISVILIAGREAERIEGILRACHRAWEEGRVAETLVCLRNVDGDAQTPAIAARLCGVLPGLRLLPAGMGPGEALAEAAGQAVWTVDLARIPPEMPHGLLLPGICLLRHQAPRPDGGIFSGRSASSPRPKETRPAIPPADRQT